VGTVGPDDVARAHRRGLVARRQPARRRLGAAPDGQRHAIVVLHETLADPVATEVQRRLRARRPIEGSLERGLVEEVVVAPARGVRRRHVELEGRLAVGSDPRHAVDLAQVVADLVDDPQALEDPHGLAVEPECARQRVELRMALDDHHAMALPCEQGRQRLPDGAVADDCDVGHGGRCGAHGAACSGGFGAAAMGGFGLGSAR
jgi:hypothetical protein